MQLVNALNFAVIVYLGILYCYWTTTNWTTTTTTLPVIDLCCNGSQMANHLFGTDVWCTFAKQVGNVLFVCSVSFNVCLLAELVSYG